MTSAIGSISSYSSSMSSLKAYPDPTIKAQLDALGLQPTGTNEGDLAAINAAKAQNNSDSSDNSNTKNNSANSPKSPPPQDSPPWASLMQELGLSLTGTKEGDFAAIQGAISNLESQAKTEDEKTKAASYQSQFQTISAQANSTPFSAELNQIATINKAMINM